MGPSLSGDSVPLRPALSRPAEDPIPSLEGWNKEVVYLPSLKHFKVFGSTWAFRAKWPRVQRGGEEANVLANADGISNRRMSNAHMHQSLPPSLCELWWTQPARCRAPQLQELLFSFEKQE